MSRHLGLTGALRGVLEKGGGLLAAVCWLTIAGVTLADVVGRYLFSAPLFGSFEMVQALMAVGLFLSMPVVALNRGMVIVELVIQKCPASYRNLLHVVTGLTGAAFFALISYALWMLTEGALHSGEVTTLLRLPHWIVGVFLGVFAAVTALCCLVAGFAAPLKVTEGEVSCE